MLYKPNFCCHCGEKIERTEWNLLTSRRFCEACAAENKRHDRLPQLAVAGGVLAVMFGFGTMFGGGRAHPLSVPALNASPALSNAEATTVKRAEKSEAPNVASVPPQVATQTTPSPVASAPAKTYYCGALTKKGTPCSRKVKSAGVRCYQHEGQPPVEPGA